ncbi:MAG: hypothetical protein LBI14_05130 [Treponema sp.]|jgi:predicted aldo/keto reductase-like oxidoreductase|nr:hypothetical protein [Treponema sp.]
MEKNIFWRTKLEVTEAGLGAGGHSRLGMAKFGQGLKGIERDRYVLSTKFPYKNIDGSIKSAKELEKTLEQNLMFGSVDCVSGQ